MSVIIYHNPRCTKSRLTLDLIRQKGIEPVVVEYLATPPSADELRRIVGMLGIPPRALMRSKEAAEVGLDDGLLSDDLLIEGMVKHPATIERPIVVAGERAAIGRPPENILDILP